MGMLTYLRRSGACGRRQRQPQTATLQVCPISGQAGVCPVSGQKSADAQGVNVAKAAQPPAVAGSQAISGKGDRGAAAEAEREGAAAKAYAEVDPLLGAKSEADAETAAELKEQGGELFKRKAYGEALEKYNEALLLQPKNGANWLNRSIVNRQLKNWEIAREDAEIACELQPGNAKAHYSQALCLHQLGKLQKAFASCRAGLAAQPDSKALLQFRNVVARALEEEGQPRKLTQQSTPQDVGIATPSGQPRAVDEDACPVSRLKDNDLQDIKKAAESAMYEWKGNIPSSEEREGLKSTLTHLFREKFQELKASAKAAESKRSTIPTDQYESHQKQGLQLEGGHQPMKRPASVDLPETYKQPLGVITMPDLNKYGIGNPDRRYLISVYGNVFDVSDRPDKYGPDGPYTILTGNDITWGLFAGVDTSEYVNRCYDLFKAKDMGKDKIAGVCSWLAWYWTEYGDPVAQLLHYQDEGRLPAPPLSEVDETCSVM